MTRSGDVWVSNIVAAVGKLLLELKSAHLSVSQLCGMRPRIVLVVKTWLIFVPLVLGQSAQ